MAKIVWGENQMHVYLYAWHILKVWHFNLMEKIKKQWGAMCNIG
jgi:hypothetical protein